MFLPLLKAQGFVPVPFLPALVVAVQVPWAAGGERLEGRIRQEKGLGFAGAVRHRLGPPAATLPAAKLPFLGLKYC